MRRAIVIIVILAVLVTAIFFAYQRFQTAAAAVGANFQTVQIERGDLTASVGSTGTVRANQSAAILWQLTGEVGAVNVGVGNVVEKGQELATLDEASLPQSVILARADLVEARRALNQLLNSSVARAQANQALVLAQKELEDALEKRESKNYDRASPATVDEARANLVVAENAVKNALELYDMVDDRGEDDPVRAEAFAQLSAARRNRDRQLANLNWLLGRPDTVEVSEADARVALAEATLADAQREWDRLKDGPDPDDVAAAEARISALESTLEQVRLEAPFAGTITQVNVKPGDQTSQATGTGTGIEPAFRIDDLSRLLVDVEITEVDINRIRPGQPAMMTFDAISEKEYSGRVVEVASIGIAAQGVVNFTVTIELMDADASVRPGMTAAVNIITDLVESVLLVPNRAVRLREGQRVVYVLRDGNPAPQMVDVELGLASDTMSELVGGDVKEGDVLVLNPPTNPFQGGGPPQGMGGN